MDEFAYVDIHSDSSDESSDWDPETVSDNILARDMLRIGLAVRSNIDGSRAIFPSPANYHGLVSAPYLDSRTHSLQSDGLSLRDQLDSQDTSSTNGKDVFRMCSMIPTSAPPCRYGYALLNANDYSLRCPVCSSHTWATRRRRYGERNGNSSRTPFSNYYTFFQHCYDPRVTYFYHGTAHDFHNRWTDFSDAREVHVAIAMTVKQERKRITHLFFKGEIARILRSQPSFRRAPPEVINYILSLAYQLDA